MAHRDLKKPVPRKMSLELQLDMIKRKLPQLASFNRQASIVVRTNDGGDAFCLQCSAGKVELLKNQEIPDSPSIEILGKTRDLQAVLSGENDARKRFFAGAFRVRGDLRHFSDLAVELAILKAPL